MRDVISEVLHNAPAHARGVTAQQSAKQTRGFISKTDTRFHQQNRHAVSSAKQTRGFISKTDTRFQQQNRHAVSSAKQTRGFISKTDTRFERSRSNPECSKKMHEKAVRRGSPQQLCTLRGTYASDQQYVDAMAAAANASRNAMLHVECWLRTCDGRCRAMHLQAPLRSSRLRALALLMRQYTLMPSASRWV
jgi:hypothetical protein